VLNVRLFGTDVNFGLKFFPVQEPSVQHVSDALVNVGAKLSKIMMENTRSMLALGVRVEIRIEYGDSVLLRKLCCR